MSYLSVCLAVSSLLQTGQGQGTPWKTVNVEDGGYAVDLPANPVVKDRKMETPAGKIDLKVRSVRRGITTYEVASGTLPSKPDDPSATLDAARDAFLKGLKAKSKGETNVELAGHPGRELTAEIPREVVAGGAAGRARIFLVGDRLYLLSSVVPERQAKALARDVEGFFTSFRLTTPPPAPAAAAAAGEEEAPWKEYVSREGRFVVLMPGEPSHRTSTLNTPAGEKPLRTVSAMPAGGVLLSVSYSDLPGEMPEARKDEAAAASLKGLVTRAKAKVISDSKIERGELKGRQFRVEMPEPSDGHKVQMVTRMYVVGNRVYDITVFLPEGSEETVNVAKFLDSFRLLPAGLEAPDAAEAQSYAPEGKGFSVAFPGAVDVRDRDGQGAYYCAFEGLIYSVGVIDQTEFAASLKPETALNVFVEGAVKSFDGKLVSEQVLTLEGHPGKEYVFDTTQVFAPDGLRVYARAYVLGSGKRLYDVRVAIPKGKAKEDPDKLKAFFDSFRITGK